MRERAARVTRAARTSALEATTAPATRATTARTVKVRPAMKKLLPHCFSLGGQVCSSEEESVADGAMPQEFGALPGKTMQP